MHEKKLLGHSGCDIRLVEQGLRRFVRKYSSSPEYNQRLKAQCAKQQTVGIGSFKAPKVMNEGVSDDGLYFFDMEYIQGVTLAKRLERMHMSDVPKVSRDLYEAVLSGNEKLVRDPLVKETIYSKVDATYCLIQGPSAAVTNAFKVLAAHDWSGVPSSSCHGDLTFENIIVSNGDLYLIDYLDSFCNSWMIDMSKIYQDIDALWSFRAEKNNNTTVKLLVMRDLFDKWLSSDNPSFLIEVRYMLLLSLLRIYPYAQDSKTVHFLNGRISFVLDEIELLKGVS